MGIAIAIIVLIIIIGYLFYQASTKKKTQILHSEVSSPNKDESLTKRVRLTNQQIVALSAASIDKPIYGEDPSLMHAQMPNGGACFNLRTIESLVKRGYLKSDGKGGYLLTSEGVNGLRSGMGF